MALGTSIICELLSDKTCKYKYFIAEKTCCDQLTTGSGCGCGDDCYANVLHVALPKTKCCYDFLDFPQPVPHPQSEVQLQESPHVHCPPDVQLHPLFFGQQLWMWNWLWKIQKIIATLCFR
jgi:hypothetical protein